MCSGTCSNETRTLTIGLKKNLRTEARGVSLWSLHQEQRCFLAPSSESAPLRLRAIHSIWEPGVNTPQEVSVCVCVCVCVCVYACAPEFRWRFQQHVHEQCVQNTYLFKTEYGYETMVSAAHVFNSNEDSNCRDSTHLKII